MMMGVIDITRDAQHAHPHRASQIAGRHTVGAKALKGCGTVGGLQKVGHDTAADVTAISLIGEPGRRAKTSRCY
jgi:flagellar biosynthesis/type III secretory pathway ATPase